MKPPHRVSRRYSGSMRARKANPVPVSLFVEWPLSHYTSPSLFVRLYASLLLLSALGLFMLGAKLSIGNGDDSVDYTTFLLLWGGTDAAFLLGVSLVGYRVGSHWRGALFAVSEALGVMIVGMCCLMSMHYAVFLGVFSWTAIFCYAAGGLFLGWYCYSSYMRQNIKTASAGL